MLEDPSNCRRTLLQLDGSFSDLWKQNRRKVVKSSWFYQNFSGSQWFSSRIVTCSYHIDIFKPDPQAECQGFRSAYIGATISISSWILKNLLKFTRIFKILGKSASRKKNRFQEIDHWNVLSGKIPVDSDQQCSTCARPESRMLSASA